MSHRAIPEAEIPKDNGQRPSFNPATGEVRGSGVGAGGGQSGEDFDSDEMTGDGYPVTGGEGTDHTVASKGPPHFKE